MILNILRNLGSAVRQLAVNRDNLIAGTQANFLGRHVWRDGLHDDRQRSRVRLEVEFANLIATVGARWNFERQWHSLALALDFHLHFLAGAK